jgi:hypothetical protein
MCSVKRKPDEGIWTLTSPCGKQYKADSPLKCCKAEVNERIPVKEQLENIAKWLYSTCDMCQDEFSKGEKKYYLGDKNTPAYLGPICGACYGTLTKLVSSVQEPS